MQYYFSHIKANECYERQFDRRFAPTIYRPIPAFIANLHKIIKSH